MGKIKNEYYRTKNVIHVFFRPQDGNVKSSFVALILCYLGAISALLRANYTYMDDIARNIWGYRRFGFNRHLSNMASILVHGDTYITDISPITQVFAAVIVAAASLVLLLAFSRGGRLRLWDIIAVLPLGLSPYFLECFSYKFDSIYMALSVLASVLPLILINAHGTVYMAAVAVSAVMVSTTYQASSGIFPMTVVFLVCRMWCENEDYKKMLNLILKSVVGYLIGLVFFAVFLMEPIDEGYASTSMFSLREMPYGIYQNLQHYYRQVILIDFDMKWLVCVGLIAVAFVIYSACHSKRKKALSLFVVGFGAVFAAVMAFGAYVALEEPLYDCRAMLGFGALVSLLGVNTVNMKKTLPVKLVCLCLTWMFMVFSLTYGNALEEHQRYIDFRVEAVIHELNDLEVMQSGETVELQIAGDTGDSPVIKQMKYFVPMLDRLIQSGFREGEWVYNWFYFFEYFGLDNLTRVSNLDVRDMELVKPGFYQDIYGEGNKVLVVLKDPNLISQE